MVIAPSAAPATVNGELTMNANHAWMQWLCLFAIACTALPATAVAERNTNTIEVAVTVHRDRVMKFIEREDVRAELAARGIDPQRVEARVDSLNRQELAQLSAEIDQLSLFGNSLIAFIGAGLLLGVIILITDLLGVTKVLPFVGRQ
jgi:hypothetical protein